MTQLAIPAGAWAQASVGDSTEVSIATHGPVGLIVFVGAAQPLAASFMGFPVPGFTSRDRMPIEAGDQVWIRSHHASLASIAIVWPHAEPA